IWRRLNAVREFAVEALIHTGPNSGYGGFRLAATLNAICPRRASGKQVSRLRHHSRSPNTEANTMHELVQLNYNFGKAEKDAEKPPTKERTKAFFARHLHEKLGFRRAGGAVANKEEFLSNLASPDNETKQL